MTIEVLPTSQMEEETQELLEDVMDEELALEFIKEHGQGQFREYYEQYEGLVEEYGQGLVDAYIEDYFVSAVEFFEEAYQGEYESGAEFAEQTVIDCGYINNNIPSWVEIDWAATWENLSYDYSEITMPNNRIAIFSNNY